VFGESPYAPGDQDVLDDAAAGSVVPVTTLLAGPVSPDPYRAMTRIAYAVAGVRPRTRNDLTASSVVAVRAPVHVPDVDGLTSITYPMIVVSRGETALVQDSSIDDDDTDPTDDRTGAVSSAADGDAELDDDGDGTIAAPRPAGRVPAYHDVIFPPDHVYADAWPCVSPRHGRKCGTPALSMYQPRSPAAAAAGDALLPVSCAPTRTTASAAMTAPAMVATRPLRMLTFIIMIPPCG
jgi:hypothetical protein